MAKSKGPKMTKIRGGSSRVKKSSGNVGASIARKRNRRK